MYESLWGLEDVKWAVADSNGILYDAGWFLYVCVANSQRNYHSMVYCFVSCMLFSFGSGLVLGVLNGEPCSVLHSDDYVIVYAVVWFIIFFTPLKRLARTRIAECIIHGLASVSWMRGILSAVWFSQQKYPESYFAVLFLGTLAGSSGDILNTIEKNAWGEITKLNLSGAKVSLICVILYLCFGKCTPEDITCVMEDRTIQTVITTYLCCWGWIIILAQVDINLLYPVEFLWHYLARILGTWYDDDYKNHQVDFRVSSQKKQV